MTGDDDRRSMDDVLSSIRRIMRPDAEGRPADEGGRRAREAEEEHEEPLPLTDRVHDLEMPVAPAGGVTSPGPVPPRAIDEPPERDDPASASPAPGVPADADALLELVRRVVREELVDGDLGRNLSENLRRLVAEEVARALRDHD